MSTPNSPTAGGFPGTRLNGPWLLQRTMDEGATSSPPSGIACVGPFLRTGQIIASSSALMSQLTGGAVGFTTMVMPKGGVIVGLSIKRATANSAGTWGGKVLKGTTVALTKALTAVGQYATVFSTAYHNSTQQFAPGDTLSLRVTTGASYTAFTGDFVGYIWVA